MITGEDVLWALGLMRRAGLHFWVDGGWGVDALLGEQTREHDDLDIALASQDFAQFVTILAPEGFREACRDGPFNPVFAGPGGRRIDVHLVDTGTETTDERGRRVYGGEGLPYPVEAFAGTGEIVGVPVPCCTAEFQISSHTGYPIDENDVRDVLALGKRFGIALPPEYSDPDSS